MRERGSISLRIETLAVLLAIPLFTAGCGPRNVWGYPADQLQLRLSTERYAVLASVEFPAQDPSQVLALSPGAPYYLSFVFDSLGKGDEALRMLELAWARCPEPWKREAGILLGQKYNERKSWPQAIQVARAILSSAQPQDVEQRARRVLVEALYWTQDGVDALREAERLANPDPEVLLFRGVSSLRLGLPEAHDLILRLFLRERASSLHARFFTFLAAMPQYAEGFSDSEKDLIAAKNDLFLGDWDAGIPLMESVLSLFPPPLTSAGVLVADLAAAYQAAGKQAPGARFLVRVSARLEGRARADALEQAGKLYRRLRLYPEALSALRSSISYSQDSAQRDRARWYILDMLISANPSDVVAEVDKELAAAGDAGVFSDLLEDWVSRLVAARKWKVLASLWKVAQIRGPSDVTARLDYILGRASQEGLLPSAASLPLDSRELLRQAAANDPDGYYGFMASSVLGGMPGQTKGPAGQSAGQSPGQPAGQPGQPPAAGAESKTALDPFITGFLPFGLFQQAYQKWVETRATLSDSQLLAAARLMAQVGDYAGSMHLMGILARRRALSPEEQELEYPRAFDSVISGLSASSGIKDSILYGLVREESFFDPDIVSAAGAVGLSQLMPATAVAAARALHITEPDLHDPAVNLAIGVRHFQELLKSVNSIPKALLSYNAGLTRVRAWEKAAGDLPADMFVESVPFDETRKYVRKILVSSVMYASLYNGQDPRDAALSFFSIQDRAGGGSLHP